MNEKEIDYTGIHLLILKCQMAALVWRDDINKSQMFEFNSTVTFITISVKYYYIDKCNFNRSYFKHAVIIWKEC